MRFLPVSTLAILSLGSLTLFADVRAVRADPPVRGIPGAKDVDHVGLTVPDLDQAVKFFVDVLGADLLWTDGQTSRSQG